MPRGVLSTQISESSLALSIGSSGSLSATSLDSSTDVFASDMDYESSNEAANVDDDALSELIRKLKGQGGTISHVSKDDSHSMTAPESVSSEPVDDNMMEDDLIERHLKALAQSTTKPTRQKVSRDVESDNEYLESDDDASQYYSEEESLGISQHQAPTCDEVNGNDEDPVDDVYNAAEKIVQKLLGEKPSIGSQDQDDINDNNDHKTYLKSMVESSTRFDYRGAPKTASTQNVWLTNLAKDLLREDSGSDGESSIEEEHYHKNISNLTKASESARQLIESSAKQQKKMEAWREKQRAKKPEFQSREAKGILKPRRIEAKLNVTTYAPRNPADTIDNDHEAHNDGACASDIDSVFTPVDRIAPADEFTIVPNAAPAFPTLLDPVRPAAEIVVPIIPKKQKTSKYGKKKELKDIVHAATEERSHTKSGAAVSETFREDATSPSPSNNETYVDRVEKMKGSDDVEPEAAAQQLLIPEGMPPYPGFGPKWPWHPNSSEKPPGYRECYMHHMGDTYYEYMEYLRTRAEHKDDHETSSEKILRHSLRQEAKFKKPKPALSPYTFTSRPGKARENCVVGGPKPLPKIDEGSNSSGSRSSETNAMEKKIQQIKTQPDVLTVGKYHAKAKKGRKAKIVVVSGSELDQKAKKKLKQSRKLHTTSSIHSDGRSEQPHDLVDHHCMCSIM